MSSRFFKKFFTTGQGIKHDIQINVFSIDERSSAVLLQ